MATDNRTLIAKSLTGAAGTGGAALIPEYLIPTITNAVPRISVELAVMTPVFGAQSIHSFDQLTALNAIGSAMGEASTTPTTQPTYTRNTVTLKVMKKKGATTDFLRFASADRIDAAAANIEATLTAFVHDLCHYNMYGNSLINTYAYSGWDYFISTNRINQPLGGTAISSLSFMNDMLDRNIDLQGERHNKAFFMSSRMLSRVTELYTNFRDTVPVSGSMNLVDVPGGHRLTAYRNVPIIPSGQTRPRETTGVCSVTHADSYGVTAIADNTTRYFRVAGVSKNGEQIAYTELTDNTGSSGSANQHTQIITIAPDATVYEYKIYVGTSSGNCYLRHIIPNFTYTADGTFAGSVTQTETGVKSFTTNAAGQVITVTFLADPYVASTSVTAAMQLDVPFITTGGIEPETIWLIDLDEFQGMGRMPYTNPGGSQFNGLVSVEFLAKVDSQLPFLLQAYTAVAPSYEATSILYRGARIA
jgi:hypothetical protein